MVESLDMENSCWSCMVEWLKHFKVFHIPKLARIMISVSKMDDVGVKAMLNKDTYKMVQKALVLTCEVEIGELYKLLGSNVIDGCNNYVLPKSGAKYVVVSRENTMLWHQRFGNIREKALKYFMVMIWYKVCLISLWISILVNIVYRWLKK